MANATKPFPLSPDRFAALETELPQAGGTWNKMGPLTGTFFPPSHPEIELGYAYNGTDTITLEILKEGFFEFADEVWAGVAPYLSNNPPTS